jgi:UDP-2-acetamido-2,6-beta-L-arabino-hexul-4-ose reductase
MIMRVLITGWKGFIGKNLNVRLGEFEGYEVIGFGRGDTLADLEMCVKTADAVIHLAGVNRPKDESEFVEDNTNLTRRLCEYIAASSRKIPLIVASSVQVDMPNPYGESKRAAEEAAIDLANRTGNPVIIFRLPNVFGKWCRPNYNSVVATFCHNIANNLPVTINNASTLLTLVYIDEVVDNFLNVLNKMTPGLRLRGVDPVYCITLGELATQIEAFNNCRT